MEKQVEISDDALPALRQTDDHQVRPHGKIPRLPRAGRESHAPDAGRSGADQSARGKNKRRALPDLRQADESHAAAASASSLAARIIRSAKASRRSGTRPDSNARTASHRPTARDKPGDIVEKKSRGRGKPFYACTRYPDCTFVMNKKPESEEELQAAFKYWKENPPKPKKAKKIKTAIAVRST